MEIVFQTLPTRVDDFLAMPEFDHTTPSRVAALYIVALCAYRENAEECYKMINVLKGPEELNLLEKQFIRNRMLGKAEYLGKAYFKGAKPENDYTPDLPYTVLIEEGPFSYAKPGFAKVYVHSSGSDIPRPLELRQKRDQWFLWEHMALLGDLKRTKGQDPWV